ncbi:MAG: DNA polymerase IV [Firmicutes bacterium]|nr:DNA polymerase IV [Bacillota bacterium]
MTIMHVDANSAYLSWTAVNLLKQGFGRDIREIPSVIGGNQEERHGIVLAKSISAKKYGIKTGESLFEAKRKCPKLEVFPPDFKLYMSYSNAMYKILSEYSPVIQRYSIDECYLDYTGSEICFGDPLDCAQKIKERIKSELGFTVNIGVSCNKLLAKMGSELKKPDMVHSLFPEEIKRKMWPLPIEELFMVGRSAARKLRKININTIGDLAVSDLELIKRLLKSQGALIWRYANGIDDEPVCIEEHTSQKCIGNSTTVNHDVKYKEEAYKILLALTEKVALRLRKTGYFASIISINITNSSFSRYGHQMKLTRATDSTSEIYQKVKRLFDECWKGDPIRLLGVSVTEFTEECEYNMNMFEQCNIEEYRAVDEAVDKIREKFGESALIRGTFVGSGNMMSVGGKISGVSGYKINIEK